MNTIKNILKEFRDFAVKGNVIDLAVGIIIGAAFNSIVNSLVNDIVNPVISLILGSVDFSNRFIVLSRNATTTYPTIAAAKAAGVATLNYGLFINNIINFLIVAFVIFIIVREINAFKRKLQHPQTEAAKESDTKVCPFCKSTVQKDATRCAFCTSDLSAPAK